MTAGPFRYGPSVQPGPANYTEVVKKLRRRLKQHSADSIIETCLAILDHWRGKDATGGVAGPVCKAGGTGMLTKTEARAVTDC